MAKNQKEADGLVTMRGAGAFIANRLKYGGSRERLRRRKVLFQSLRRKAVSGNVWLDGGAEPSRIDAATRSLRILATGLIVSTLMVGAALADIKWSGPGWYVDASAFFAIFLVRGPYQSKEECERTIPNDGQHKASACDYYGSPPDWERHQGEAR